MVINIIIIIIIMRISKAPHLLRKIAAQGAYRKKNCISFLVQYIYIYIYIYVCIYICDSLCHKAQFPLYGVCLNKWLPLLVYCVTVLLSLCPLLLILFTGVTGRTILFLSVVCIVCITLLNLIWWHCCWWCFYQWNSSAVVPVTMAAFVRVYAC